jgi:uncharacterized membrane protein
MQLATARRRNEHTPLQTVVVRNWSTQKLQVRLLCFAVFVFCLSFAVCVDSTFSESIPAAVPLIMSTSHDLVAAAKAPELHFKKRAIFTAYLLLVALGVLAITSTPSRKKGREELYLFHRTLQLKPTGSSNTTASPTNTPTMSPTNTQFIELK